MIWRGVEGDIARNGLTIFYPHLLIILKLTRRFILRFGRVIGNSPSGDSWVRLTIDTQRDHSMYRAADMDTPSLMCRRCDIWHNILIQYHNQYQCEGDDIKLLTKVATSSGTPPAFCSGKFYRWER